MMKTEDSDITPGMMPFYITLADGRRVYVEFVHIERKERTQRALEYQSTKQ